MSEEADMIPKAVAWLGYGGLVPPLVLILAEYLLPPGPVAWSAIVAPYSALIFAFLGGSWWTFALKEEPPETSLLVLAVAAPLLALATFFAGPRLMNILLAILIALSPLADLLFRQRGLVPDWWMRFRFRLSMGLSGLTALALYPTYFSAGF